MGKRELVLIALFLVAGVVVYQVTAPPPPPGSDLSVGGIFQRIRREMQGARETASGESRKTVSVAPGATLVRITLPRPNDLTITGADRDDISIEMRSVARGFTQAEAKAAADAAMVKAETTGDAIALTGAWEDHRGPAGYVTQAAITITLPRRLALRLQPHTGLLSVTNVTSIDVVSSRGETHVTGTVGDVQLGHVGGTLEVSGGASLKLTARNSRGEISKLTGTVRIEATGSRLKLSDLRGRVDLESHNSDLTFADANALKAPLRYNGVGGSLRIEGLRTEARIDGRNTDLDVRLAAPAPVTIYNLGAIVVTAPPGGYTLDATTSEGRISIDESGITPSEGPEARAAGKVRGGGPVLTLRATRGRIEIRKGDGK
jgi:hypothetical protein